MVERYRRRHLLGIPDFWLGYELDQPSIPRICSDIKIIPRHWHPHPPMLDRSGWREGEVMHGPGASGGPPRPMAARGRWPCMQDRARLRVRSLYNVLQISEIKEVWFIFDPKLCFMARKWVRSFSQCNFFFYICIILLPNCVASFGMR